jgi:death on curing protein
MVQYLSVFEVVSLHQQVMEQAGLTSVPLRSEDLLESALGRAQAAAYYNDADLAMQASVLAIGISQNQPFLDGNKRTALFSLLMFIGINGLRYTDDPYAIADRLVAVAEREGSLEEATEAFAAWLRERLVART